MTDLLLFLILAVLVASMIFQVLTWLSVRRLGFLAHDGDIPVCHFGSTFPPVVFYSIWSYEGARWVLLRRCGQVGCGCDRPPDRPGEFEGEVLRKECRPR